MASQLIINFANDVRFNRDLDEVCEAWNYEGALALDPTLTKKNFIEKRLKEYFQGISKQSRTSKAIASVIVED